jgi:ATP-dependent Clp endopeptidase proteolytic subunit ClpP
MEGKMNWFEIKAKADVTEVWLYDEIGMWGTSAKQFVTELSAIKSPQIELHINSPGGDVFDGIAIYNVLKNHPAQITSYIDGIAASIASVIALAGKRVVMAGNALWMMHNPVGVKVGAAEDMRKMADVLDKVRDTLVQAYSAKSGQTDDEIKALLDAETWLDADEAKEAGFVDEVGDEMDLAACAKFVPVLAKLGCQHVPENLGAAKTTPSVRDLERALRDAGCSPKQAKSILAKGVHQNGSLRDEEPVQVDPPQPPEPQRDVEPPVAPARTDHVSELLTRAEMIAPSAA